MNEYACAVDDENEFPNGRAWISKTGLVVLFFCTAHSLDLLQSWQTSPLDRWAWIALLIWLSPLAIIRILDEKHEYVMRESVGFYAMAVALTLLGQLGSLNVVQHCGLLLAVTGLLRSSWRTAVWLVAGTSWMPVFGWVVQQPDFLLLLRLGTAAIGAVLMLAPHAHLPHEPERILRIKRHLLVGGLVVASLMGFVWSFVPLTGAEYRLLGMPLEGDGFRSWPVPIKSEEELLLGTGLASRRVYQFSGDSVLLSVVDGTMNRHAVHDPVYCFRGSGYQIEDNQQIEIAGGKARTLTLKRNGDRFEIAYWFSDGRQRHCSVMRYWLQTTLRRISLGLSGPEPVLVILQTDRPIDGRQLKGSYQGVFLSV